MGDSSIDALSSRTPLHPASWRAGLRTRLMLLVALAVLPAFGLIVWSAYSDRQARLQEAEELAERVASRAAGEFGQIIEFTREIMGRVSEEAEVRYVTDANACGRVLAEVRKRQPAYGLIGIIARDGTTICSDTDRALGVYLGDRSYFREAIRTRNFVVGGFVVGRTTRLNLMVLAVPIINGEGEVTEVMFLSLDLGWFRNQLENVMVPPGSNLMLVDGTGTVMAVSPDDQAIVGQKIPEREFFAQDRHDAHLSGLHVTNVDGIGRMVVSVPLPRTPRDSAFVRAGIPTAGIIASANNALIRNLLILAGMALLMFSAAWCFANLLIVTPARRLIAAAEALGHGNLRARTELKHGTDELGQLARHFDQMAARVQRMTRALRALIASNRNLLRAGDESALLQDLCQIAVTEGGYRFARVGLLQGKAHAQSLVTAAIAGEGAAESQARGGGKGVGALAVKAGNTQVMNDVECACFPAPDGTLPRFAVCALPLKIHGETIGALELYANDVTEFDAAELQLLEELAADLAFGIQTVRDRHRQKAAEEKVRQMAYVDSLTGLPNRTRFEMVCGEALGAAARSGTPLAVVALALDQFSRFQSAIGFAESERLIVEVAHRIRASADAAWFVARLAGHRFAMVIPGTDGGVAAASARQLAAEFERPFSVAGVDVEVNANVGIALYPDHGDNAGLLLRRADVASLDARSNGMGVALYRGETEKENPARLQLMVKLRRAIEDGQLSIHYQGKVRAHTGVATGAEALVRWRHPDQGNIPPGDFIPLAEQTGLIKRLTRWVVNAVLRQLHLWSEAGVAVPVAINFSGHSFRDPGLVTELYELLAYWRVDPKLVQIEITETVLMNDPKAMRGVLESLRAMGLTILIDDFGTGYSSLRYLAELPADAIKIDRSFVIEMVHRPEMRALVAAIVDMGRKLGLKVIAEGVDDERQAVLLREMGCDEIQGYLYCKPLQAGAFHEWLARHAPKRSGEHLSAG
jgi:diguanylate cyclase (GGDEF)-like protein